MIAQKYKHHVNLLLKVLPEISLEKIYQALEQIKARLSKIIPRSRNGPKKGNGKSISWYGFSKFYV